MPSAGAWLLEKRSALTRRICDSIRDYDNGRITLDTLNSRVSEYVDACLTQVSDRAYSEGLQDAELDGDYEDDEEVDFIENEEDNEDDA